MDDPDSQHRADPGAEPAHVSTTPADSAQVGPASASTAVDSSAAIGPEADSPEADSAQVGPAADSAQADITGSAAADGTRAASAAAEQPLSVIPHAGLRYGVLRVAMLLTVGGVLYLIGLRDWGLLISAFLLSAIASFFVFARQRRAAAQNIEVAVESRHARRDAHHEVATPDEQPTPESRT